jgi:hypothetical protein
MLKIKEYLKNIITKAEYDIWIDPITEHITETKTIIIVVPNIYFKNKISKILKNNNLQAEIIIHEHQDLKTLEQKTIDIKYPLKTLQMEKPYGKEKVATGDIINSKFFAYPNDNRKYNITEIMLNNEKYIVHRGKNTPDPNEKPIGQLDTNHLRILLAIIHIWQEQNCKFFGIQALVNLSLTLKEIAKKIGYKISGRTIKWLKQKIEELTKYPITLEKISTGKANSFTFLSKLTVKTEEKNNRKKTIILTLNPILSQQLYERKAILRNNEFYKIKNPTALKFLLTYDKRIYAAQKQFKLNLEEISKDLEIRGKVKNIIQGIEKIVKNLNGYKITDNNQINLELIKKDRERYLMVGKKEILLNLPNIKINNNI